MTRRLRSDVETSTIGEIYFLDGAIYFRFVCSAQTRNLAVGHGGGCLKKDDRAASSESAWSNPKRSFLQQSCSHNLDLESSAAVVRHNAHGARQSCISLRLEGLRQGEESLSFVAFKQRLCHLCSDANNSNGNPCSSKSLLITGELMQAS